MILTALKQIGFDDVFEVASAKRLKAKPENFPLISSSCPAVVRLIQIRFPGLIDQIVRIEEITETLPGLDCGSCGAPTCRALAEDIVRGTAEKNDCIFILRDEMITLTKHLAELGSWMPPLLSEEQKKK
jgi:Na+-translocating ferredoxin:NAD+ oxidoreductase RNF subunit RnfB